MIARDSNAHLERADREPETEPDLALLSRMRLTEARWFVHQPALTFLLDAGLVEVDSYDARTKAGAYWRLTASGDALVKSIPAEPPHNPSWHAQTFARHAYETRCIEQGRARHEADVIEAAMAEGKATR